jgi:hypothetical protein
MTIESVAITTILIAVAVSVLLFMLTRRLMRLIFRLALAGGLILFALAGGLAWWYGASGRDGAARTTTASPKEKPSATRRANSR